MSQTVLVADDSKTIRQIVEMALKASAWEVVSVGNASEAVQAAQNGPSVILLDYFMGADDDGYDVCRQLKADAATSGIPVVMLGGTYKAFDENVARQSGADSVLMKPFNTDALLTAIEEAEANGATAAPQPAAGHGLPVPQPVYDEESEVGYGDSEPGYGAADSSSEELEIGYAADDSEDDIEIGYGDSEPGYGDSEPDLAPTPVYEVESEPEEEVPAAYGDSTPLPTPKPATTPTSQPRIPADPPQARHGSSPEIPSRQSAPATPAAPAMSKDEIENFIREEVRSTVRQELPGLLRTVMGEIFQQKVLPKLLEHAEQRVRSAVSENLAGQIQHHVRVEIERLLNED